MESHKLDGKRISPQISQTKQKGLTEVEMLRLLNFDLADLYFPMYVI